MEALILKRFSLIAITLLSILGYGFLVFAAAPSGGYVPGQTNNPACAPNDTDCLVRTGWQLNPGSNYVYNTTDNIGVGTTAPVYSLEVVGDFGAQMTHTSGDISGFNLSNDLFGLGVQGVGMTTIASSTKIFLNGILDFGTGNGSTLYYFDTANGESASISATDFNGTTPLVLGQALSSTNEATFFSVEASEGFVIAGPHDNSSQTPNTGAYAFRVLDRDINASGVQTWLSVMNDGQVSIANLASCSSIQTDANGLTSCGSGSGAITVENTSSLFSTGLTGTGSGSTAMDSVFLGQYAGFGATGANLSNFIGNQAGYNATSANNANFLGTNAGYSATSAQYANFFGLSAGYQAANAAHSNFFGNLAGYNATNASQSNFFGPSAGYGASSAGNSNFIGPGSGYNATNANNANFLGTNAGNSATGAYRANFLGGESGTSASGAFESNFLGYYSGYAATNASSSNFLGSSAGYQATGAAASNFIGLQTGYQATNAQYSNFIGANAGYAATNAAFSNFIGLQAGYQAFNATNSIFIGRQAGYNDTVDNTPSVDNFSILIGQYSSTGGYSNSIALGAHATNNASNQLMIGSSTRPINDLVITGAGFTTCSVDLMTGAGLACSSDERLKKNITDLSSNILDSLTKLKTVTFNWRSGGDTDTHIGFLAQDIQQYYPELVSTAPNGYLQVNYAGITPVLVEAIRELNIKMTDIQKVADAVDPTFLTSLKTWLGSVTNGLGKITANELCVHDANGETCLNRDQVNQIQSTISNGGGGITTPTIPDPTPTPSGSSSTSTDPAPNSGGGTSSDPVPAPTPDPVPPVPTPDLVPPAPDPVPVPDPIPTPDPVPEIPQTP